ncbi:MAG: hypothetical protein JF595_12700 [Sphingomonadales bacterium]|nr:hypothetical protein [Sphingomonadales bacterium]
MIGKSKARSLRLASVAALWLGAAGSAQADVRIPGFELVHNAPVETTLATPDIRDPARTTIDFEQFYVAGKSGSRLDRVLASLEAAGRRGVRIRFLMEQKGLSASDEPTLARLKAIPNLTFRLLEFGKLAGDGIIHAKFFVVDGRAAYVGSQNFDWRSLEHIDETGLRIDDPRMVGQIKAIFAQDWLAQERVAQGLPVPDLRTADDTSDEGRPAFLVASPNRFNPPGVGYSEAALPRLIAQAKREIHVEVMEYAALARDGSPYPVIDDALRAAAGRGVKVRLLIADWDLTPARLPSLRSLASVPNVEIRVVRIPEASVGPIPYARVIHTKVMTIDGATAWVGTSNWEGGYLDHSRDLEVVLQSRTMASRLDALQQQGWTSVYAKGLEGAIAEREAQQAQQAQQPQPARPAN